METPLKQTSATVPDLPEETRMDLLLWRHAEAEDGYPDLKRKLTARGEKQAQQMAEWLKKHAPKNLRNVASPATRCQQTAQALGLPFETDRRLSVDSHAANVLAAAACPRRRPERRGTHRRAPADAGANGSASPVGRGSRLVGQKRRRMVVLESHAARGNTDGTSDGTRA